MEIINLDMVPGKKSPVCHASQYDDGRVIRFNLYDSGLPYTLDGTETITFEVRKPDGNIVTSTLTNTSDSYVEVITTEQMTAVKGANLCEVRVEKGATNIGSLNVIMAVEMDPTDGGIASASEIDNLRSQISGMVAEEVAEQYDAGSVIFDSAPTSGHGNGYAVTSEGVFDALAPKANRSELSNYYTKLETDTALDGKVDTSDFDATNLPISSGDPTNTKAYIDGRAPIYKGGHATDLSTTGLTTGTYLYNYDNTTNGVPKANTEGDCFIVINNTQTWGCELALSNSGLYWRNKANQVWGNWEDIIGKLTVDSAISASPIDVNGTYQIPDNVLKHNLIVITFRRYGYAASVVATRSGITGGTYVTQYTRAIVANSYWDIKINESGLITLLAKGDTTVPYIEVFGYL